MICDYLLTKCLIIYCGFRDVSSLSCLHLFCGCVALCCIRYTIPYDLFCIDIAFVVDHCCLLFLVPMFPLFLLICMNLIHGTSIALVLHACFFLLPPKWPKHLGVTSNNHLLYPPSPQTAPFLVFPTRFGGHLAVHLVRWLAFTPCWPKPVASCSASPRVCPVARHGVPWSRAGEAESVGVHKGMDILYHILWYLWCMYIHAFNNFRLK